MASEDYINLSSLHKRTCVFEMGHLFEVPKNIWIQHNGLDNTEGRRVSSQPLLPPLLFIAVLSMLAFVLNTILLPAMNATNVVHQGLPLPHTCLENRDFYFIYIYPIDQ